MSQESEIERAPRDMAGSLSQRERQLLHFAARGMTDQAISNRLGISLATVGTYWGRIRIKFGPLNRTELVAVYLREEASKTISALREENERLIEQLDHHAQVEDMLKTSLDLFRGLIETAPDAILLVDQDGAIELANEQAEQMFGYGSGEMLGVNVDDLVPTGIREQHRERRAGYNANPVKRRMGEHLATHAKRRDGTEFLMATALSATTTPNGLLITCIIRDLTEPSG